MGGVAGVGVGLQVGVTEPLIGLHVGTLGPFVPGIDEQQALVAAELLFGALDGRFEPGLERPRGGMLESVTVVLSARGIVPASGNTEKALVIGQSAKDRQSVV